MLFYFSGTGNSRWIAETIADAVGERLIDITGGQDYRIILEYRRDSAEPIGFCFPVHGWQPPKIFRRFIRSLDIDNSSRHYCYAVCTCGDNAGKAMDIFAKDIAAKGLVLHSAFSLIMPESYVCLPFMYTDTKEREQEKIMESGMQMKNIIDIIRKREIGHWHIVEGPVPWILTYVIGNFFNRFMITDKPFRVDKDVCRRCGICKHVCPTSNISYDSDGVPQWKCNGNCTCCLACYHHCPVHAINYGNITRHRGQYFFKH